MTFASYIIMLGGIVAVMVVIELVLPDSQTSKYIRSICGIFVVFAIVSPLPNIIQNAKNSIESSTNIGDDMLDENFLQHIFEARRKNLQENITEALKIDKLIVDINLTIESYGQEFKVIYSSVFVYNFSGDKNDAINRIKRIIKKYIIIEDENISIIFGG